MCLTATPPHRQAAFGSAADGSSFGRCVAMLYSEHERVRSAGLECLTQICAVSGGRESIGMGEAARKLVEATDGMMTDLQDSRARLRVIKTELALMRKER